MMIIIHKFGPKSTRDRAMDHSDVGRADARCRAMMEPHIENFTATAARVLGNENEDEAILAASAMVGAPAISRVITDARRADAILRVVPDAVIAMSTEC
jgi:TetR/AcrR family transcriptional regulator, transcriptional repressor for nem operon